MPQFEPGPPTRKHLEELLAASENKMDIVTTELPLRYWWHILNMMKVAEHLIGSMRDVSTNPRPGDEIFGPVIKTKILAVTFNETGLAEVKYTMSGAHQDYKPEFYNLVGIKQWQRLVNHSDRNKLTIKLVGAR